MNFRRHTTSSSSSTNRQAPPPPPPQQQHQQQQQQVWNKRLGRINYFKGGVAAAAAKVPASSRSTPSGNRYKYSAYQKIASANNYVVCLVVILLITAIKYELVAFASYQSETDNNNNNLLVVAAAKNSDIDDINSQKQRRTLGIGGNRGSNNNHNNNLLDNNEAMVDDTTDHKNMMMRTTAPKIIIPKPPKPKLNLSVISGTYAVVRLGANSKPPDWLWESRFYSLSKTDDELSIVCEQDKVPSDILRLANNNNDNDNNQQDYRCETDWGLFKVEGPLDFSLTGILHKLATPLAKAGISIFAVSTYDTDYILVKEKLLFQAGYLWMLDGHAVQGLPGTRTPVDGHNGPVLTFETDPMIQRMMDLILQQQQQQKGGGEQQPPSSPSSVEETFGLVLVSGWVPSEAVQSAYNEKFLPAVRKVFQEIDLQQPQPQQSSSSSKASIPNVYLYPSQSLHVTVATLHGFHHPLTNDDGPSLAVLEKEWTDLVTAASQRDEWPRRPLQLSLVSAQIGKSAGILLWDETTGGLDQMRICIEAEAERRHDQLTRAGIDANTLKIPAIIHSTFLRFHDVPVTPGQDVQDRFQLHVKDQISTFFPHPIILSDAKLVCERIPYMHMEHNDRNVFATFPLGGGGGGGEMIKAE